jgi:hypothetical protein
MSKYVYVVEQWSGALEKGGAWKPREGFVPENLEDIKVVQLNPEAVKPNQEVYYSWVNQTGVTFVRYSDGRKGLKITMEDGTEVYYRVNQMGKIQKMKKVSMKDGDVFIVDDWKRKLDRFFGISDEMYIRLDKKIDYIHAGMFGLGTLIALGVVGSLAWWLHGIFG